MTYSSNSEQKQAAISMTSSFLRSNKDMVAVGDEDEVQAMNKSSNKKRVGTNGATLLSQQYFTRHGSHLFFRQERDIQQHDTSLLAHLRYSQVLGTNALISSEREYHRHSYIASDATAQPRTLDRASAQDTTSNLRVLPFLGTPQEPQGQMETFPSVAFSASRWYSLSFFTSSITFGKEIILILYRDIILCYSKSSSKLILARDITNDTSEIYPCQASVFRSSTYPDRGTVPKQRKNPLTKFCRLSASLFKSIQLSSNNTAFVAAHVSHYLVMTKASHHSYC